MPHDDNQPTIFAWQAINDALTIAMEQDENVFVIGQGVTDPKAILVLRKVY